MRSHTAGRVWNPIGVCVYDTCKFYLRLNCTWHHQVGTCERQYVYYYYYYYVIPLGTHHFEYLVGNRHTKRIPTRFTTITGNGCGLLLKRNIVCILPFFSSAPTTNTKISSTNLRVLIAALRIIVAL